MKKTKISLENIPEKPGCYLFKSKSNVIIYIGKAKKKKKRVKSYFSKTNHIKRTSLLIENIDSLDFIVTDNEVEALILENNLIKKHKPRFNIDLKDSKRYAYLKITHEDFPRLQIARKKDEKASYYGPFVSAASRDHVLYTLKKTFRLRTCKKMPKRPCLRYSIGLCDAPCINLISKENYHKKILNIKMILKGKSGYLIKKLRKQMKLASKNKDFESAIEYREQIKSLEDLSEKQKMERQKKYNEDIINYMIKDDNVYLMAFNIDKGTIINKQEFIFPHIPGFFEEFLVQYYSNKPVPKTIVFPESIDASFNCFLEKKRGSKIFIDIPQIGEKKKLLDLIKKNIELTFFSHEKNLQDLKKRLNLQDIPKVIECFDISHLSGTSTVASLVQFRNSIPDKSNYRRFKIRSFLGVDDTRAISEVVYRRYNRLKKENKNFPDLIVVDGGRAQLNSAINELKKLNLKIPVISLAKKFEEIYIPGEVKPLRLSRKTLALKLLQKIRNEAHRFAIKYNRLLRSKEMVK